MSGEGGAAVGAITCRTKALDVAIGRVSHASAPDEARPILASVLLEGDALGLRVVAADNYRIAIADVAAGEFPEVGRSVIQRDDVPMIRAFLKGRDRDVMIERNDNRLTFSEGRRSVTAILIDGAFPDYSPLVAPEKPGERQAVGINPAYIVDAAKALPKGLAVAFRLPKPDNLGRAVLLSVQGYTEIIMPIRLAGEIGGAETLPAAATS